MNEIITRQPSYLERYLACYGHRCILPRNTWIVH